jgi:DNA-binding transcriptional regulator GbsR (MarR family)
LQDVWEIFRVIVEERKKREIDRKVARLMGGD